MAHHDYDVVVWRDPEELGRLLRDGAWVLSDGEAHTEQAVWARAQLVVWLDPTLPTVLWRVLRRGFRGGEDGGVWNGSTRRRRNLLDLRLVAGGPLRLITRRARLRRALAGRPEVVRVRPREVEALLARLPPATSGRPSADRPESGSHTTSRQATTSGRPYLHVDLVALLLAALASGLITRALGVGYSLVLAPTAIAVLPAGQAVCLTLAVGVLLNAALLARSGQRRVPSGLRTLWACGVVGQFFAVGLLGVLAGTTLRAVAGVALLLGALVSWRRPAAAAREAARDHRRRTDGLAGLGLGAVGALTGITGPFAAVWLARGSQGGDGLRRCLWATVAVLSATGLAVQTAIGAGFDDAARAAVVAVSLSPAMALGVLAGDRLAGRLDPGVHRRTVVAVAAAGAVVLLAA